MRIRIDPKVKDYDDYGPYQRLFWDAVAILFFMGMMLFPFID